MIRASVSVPVALALTSANGYLDAYTYLAHDGVFATSQTGNIVLAFVALVQSHTTLALNHVWPILAFCVGVGIATVVQERSAPQRFQRHVLIAMAVQAGVLVVVGVLPADVPTALVTTSVGWVAGLQLGLFRQVGASAFITVASTGNLVRLVEASAAWLGRRAPARHCALYLALVLIFASGALLGAVLTEAIGTQSCWVPAALVAAALVGHARQDVTRS